MASRDLRSANKRSRIDNTGERECFNKMNLCGSFDAEDPEDEIFDKFTTRFFVLWEADRAFYVKSTNRDYFPDWHKLIEPVEERQTWQKNQKVNVWFPEERRLGQGTIYALCYSERDAEEKILYLEAILSLLYHENPNSSNLEKLSDSDEDNRSSDDESDEYEKRLNQPDRCLNRAPNGNGENSKLLLSILKEVRSHAKDTRRKFKSMKSAIRKRYSHQYRIKIKVESTNRDSEKLDQMDMSNLEMECNEERDVNLAECPNVGYSKGAIQAETTNATEKPPVDKPNPSRKQVQKNCIQCYEIYKCTKATERMTAPERKKARNTILTSKVCEQCLKPACPDHALSLYVCKKCAPDQPTPQQWADQYLSSAINDQPLGTSNKPPQQNCVQCREIYECTKLLEYMTRAERRKERNKLLTRKICQQCRKPACQEHAVSSYVCKKCVCDHTCT